jgi:hypothetical protein
LDPAVLEALVYNKAQAKVVGMALNTGKIGIDNIRYYISI